MLGLIVIWLKIIYPWKISPPTTSCHSAGWGRSGWRMHSWKIYRLLSPATALGCPVYNLYACRDEEIQAFRCSSLAIVEEAVQQRQKCGAASLALYHHPPTLEASPKLPVGVSSRLSDGKACLGRLWGSGSCQCLLWLCYFFIHLFVHYLLIYLLFICLLCIYSIFIYLLFVGGERRS